MEGKVMKFGQFSKTNYSISLDMKSQLFIARSNDNPKFEASGITIQDALFALSKIDKNVKFWQLLKQEDFSRKFREESSFLLSNAEADVPRSFVNEKCRGRRQLFLSPDTAFSWLAGSNRATPKILRTFSFPDSLPQYLAKEITIWV